MFKNIDETKEKTTTSKKIVWFFVVLGTIILDAIVVFLAIFITESRLNTKIGNISVLEKSVASIEREVTKTPQLISDVNIKIAENNGNIALLKEKLNLLTQEVGNNQLETLSLRLTSYANRLEELEETKNQEALVLSIALLIKENALYGRRFDTEVIALKEMARGQQDIDKDINIIEASRDIIIPTDSVLTAQYFEIMKDFDFEKKEELNTNTADQGVVTKSINKIKETVANINFDKVVVVKKDNKTIEQKQLLNTLNSLVEQNLFSKAVDFINQNVQFANAENTLFNEWVQNAEKRVAFDNAISNIISMELKAIRNNLTTKNITTTEDVDTINEDIVND